MVLLLDGDLFDVWVVATDVRVLGVRVVVSVGVDGVDDTLSYLVGGFVCGFVKTVTKTVVMTFLVGVSDVTLVRGVDGGASRSRRIYLLRVGVVLGSEGIVCGTRVFSSEGTGTLAELAFSYVNLRRGVAGGRAVDSVVMAVCGVLDLDVGVGVGVGRLGREAIAGIELGALGNRRRLELLLGLMVVLVLSDVNLVVLRLGQSSGNGNRLRATVVVDVDLFLDERVRVLGGRGRSLLLLGVVVVVMNRGEGFVDLFVTFPSRCSRFRKGSVSVAFYL